MEKKKKGDTVTWEPNIWLCIMPEEWLFLLQTSFWDLNNLKSTERNEDRDVGVSFF